MTTTLLLMLSTVLCNSPAFTQSDAKSDLTLNRSVLRYYNGLEIQAFENESPGEYQALANYFTSSFIVSPKKCIQCDVNYNDFFNQDLFNIVEFESTRHQTDTVSFLFKDKYNVMLLPLSALTVSLNGIDVSSMSELVAPRPLPEWNPTGNDSEDYEIYKRDLKVWIRDFPEKYRTLTSGSSITKIRVAEFLNLPSARRNAFTATPGTYLIID
ncbi:MAG: hypothetical protein NXI10_00295 [bacterium]|nr:hypothetical protein [bacterium]